MKKKTLSFVNRCLTAVMALLGFQACGGMVCLYGTPSADLKVRGKVTNTGKEPLKDIQVVLNRSEYDRKDTLYTDKDGEYSWMRGGWPSDSVKIVVNDTTGQYASDSTKVALSYDRKNADDWYEGVGTAEADFELKKKEQL